MTEKYNNEEMNKYALVLLEYALENNFFSDKYKIKKKTLYDILHLTNYNREAFFNNYVVDLAYKLVCFRDGKFKQLVKRHQNRKKDITEVKHKIKEFFKSI